MDPKLGDRISEDTADKKIEGIMMPSKNKDSVVVKLDSGYNMGIPKKTIKKIKLLKKFKETKIKTNKIKTSKSKKTIAILHTGGTIASKVDYNTGGVIAKYTPEELVGMFPELEDLVNVKSRLISNMFSEDMRFTHYNVMAKEIEKEIKAGADGIILTHGTDTLHYTAAALSFILEGLSVPVILVGAQRSSDRGSSDAAMNLVCAVEFMKQTDFAEVGVCMHKSMNDEICWILPGLKCRKMHSSRRDAFKPVNDEAYAEVDYKKRKIKIISGKFRKRNKEKLKLRLFKEVKVGLLKIHPSMYEEEFKLYSKFDGLVVEGTGLGHLPMNEVDKLTGEHKKIFSQVKKLGKNVPVVMSTQTIYGRVNMNVYSTGRELQEIGVIGNYSDMTPETTFIKLAWLLSNYPKKVKEMIHENIRGEINDRLNSEFLI